MNISDRQPKESARDYAFRVIKENIISLELIPGSMVSENELSNALGLSRTPVREALIELSKSQVVEIYPPKRNLYIFNRSRVGGRRPFFAAGLRKRHGEDGL